MQITKHMAALALLVSATASAGDWVKIFEGADSKVSIQLQSIAPTGKYMKAWAETMYLIDQQPNEYPFKTYRYTRDLVYFNCKERTMFTKQVVWYALNAAEQSTVVGSDAKPVIDANFFEVAPETSGETQFNAVCMKPWGKYGKKP